jgi:Tol biopolymer transport system component
VRSHPAFAPPPARSADGRTIAYARGAEIVVRRAGRERPYRVGGVPTGVAVSPGGDRILFESARRLLLLDVSSGSSRVVVARGSGPAWSPDGQTIAYSDDRGLVFLDLRTNARTPGPARAAYVSFAPDGRSVVYARVNAAQSIPK